MERGRGCVRVTESEGRGEERVSGRRRERECVCESVRKRNGIVCVYV